MSVPSKMKRGVLNLILKADKDSRFLKNLRPITLLSVGYKVIEKALANRIERGLEYVINADQRGFMKSRQISTNIRFIFDLMKYTEKNNIDACILSLDFLKCFDKIEHTCIMGSLDYFGFPSYISNWVRILYDNFAVVVQNSGNFSKPLSIEKGVHQGGCVSSLLFLLCAETLALEFRNNKEIKGIPVNEILNLLGQFADDMDVYQLFDKKSLDTVFEVIEQFKLHSCFTISYDKTQICEQGRRAYRPIMNVS